MIRRSLAALVLLVMSGVGGAGQQPAGTGPNIVLIQADDLGFGDVGAYGQKRFETPSLDRLAREGTRFTQYYSGSTVCAPSRAALMTGKHTGHAWIRGNGALPEGDVPLRAEEVTIAELLRERGYRTGLVGKWGLGQPGTPGMPDKQGFDYAFGFLDQRHAHRQFTDHFYRNGERVAVDLERDYAGDVFTKEAAAFIERDDQRPFFLYLNYTVPHAELRAPEDSMALYRGKFPEKPFENAKADAVQSGSRPDTPSLGYRSQPAPHAAFAAMITRMDRDIGRLVDLLASRGLDRNTVVLFTSDNGPHREGGADPDVLQQLRRPARREARSLRRRHPGADDRPLAGNRSRRAGRARTRGRTGTCCRRSSTSPAARRRRTSTGCRWPGRCAARSSRRTRTSTGSSTSAAFSRPCAWDSGKRSG